ncbi:hypothetical protein JW916_01840 [Candidatus Sumerlaeota bacterium]|nr:hypothetical protein [Candidatus Sumerlaeota bacterium]
MIRNSGPTPLVRKRPMRFRIAMGLMAFLFVVFVAIGIVTAERTISGLNGSLDDSLDAVIEVSAQNAVLLANPAAIAEGTIDSRWRAGVEETFYEIRSASDGRVLASSSDLRADGDLLGPYSWKEILRRVDRDGWNVRVQGRHLRCRAESVRLPTAAGDEKTVVVAGIERDEADRRLIEILKRSAAVLGGGLVLAVFGAWLIVWRALRPLGNLVEDVSRITPDDIRPVRVPDDPDLSLLAGRLNRSLEAVAESFRREKRFSSDVAHELFTPLGGLRAEIEVAMLHPRPAEELGDAIQRCGSMVVEIQSLVENLLELARLEAGTTRPESETLDLHVEIEAAWSGLENVAGLRRVAFENRVQPGTEIEASVHLLRIVLNNLFANAARYAPPGGRVWVEVVPTPGDLALHVLNDVAGLAPDFAQRAFERFWRGDASRTRRSDSRLQGGAGLGLALARTAARAMGGDLTVEVQDGTVVCFALNLREQRPSAESSSPQDRETPTPNGDRNL